MPNNIQEGAPRVYWDVMDATGKTVYIKATSAYNVKQRAGQRYDLIPPFDVSRVHANKNSELVALEKK